METEKIDEKPFEEKTSTELLEKPEVTKPKEEEIQVLHPLVDFIIEPTIPNLEKKLKEEMDELREAGHWDKNVEEELNDTVTQAYILGFVAAKTGTDSLMAYDATLKKWKDRWEKFWKPILEEEKIFTDKKIGINPAKRDKTIEYLRGLFSDKAGSTDEVKDIDPEKPKVKETVLFPKKEMTEEEKVTIINSALMSGEE